jgi:hypothetical protein
MADRIVFGFIVLIFFLIIGIILYKDYQQARHKRAIWQAVAAANGLIFAPGNWWRGGACVFGNYRQHPLKLETFQKGRGSPDFTRITVAQDPAGVLAAGQAAAGQTSASELINRFTAIRFSASRLRGEVKAKAGEGVLYYESVGVEDDTSYLQNLFDWLVDLVDAYAAVAPLGGEAVPALQGLARAKSSELRQVAEVMLQDIAAASLRQFKGRPSPVFCPRCLAVYTVHQVHLSWRQSVSYYGCRLCSQNREFLEADRGIIAVLDRNMSQGQTHQDHRLRLNWLARRELFDFTEVEIGQVTDNDVERFVLQVNNDIDAWRRPRYKEMRCLVSSQCRLSENMLRMLGRTFGRVEIE